MQCPHCRKKVTLFSVKKAPNGKGQLCPHCGGGLKVTFSVPALLGWFVAAVVVTLLLYPMLGWIATALAGNGHAWSPAGVQGATIRESVHRHPAPCDGLAGYHGRHAHRTH